jgi:peptidoglycan/LPS O-acetylase OafA/YrhL
VRNKRLDILRAFAVLLVLGRHGEGPSIWKNIGWVGVDLFFVLSGFLISGLLFSEYKSTGGLNWRRFFIRRGFKIYPAFYAMILVTLVWQLVLRESFDWRPYLPEIFFYQSYQISRVWWHTWSLAVEEHFYILLPVLLLLLLRVQNKTSRSDPFRIIPAVWAILAVSCLLQRCYLARVLPPGVDRLQLIVFATHLRIDALFFGVLLGYLHHIRPLVLAKLSCSRMAQLALLVVSIALLCPCLKFQLDTSFMLGIGLTALYLGFGGILILTLYAPFGKTDAAPRHKRLDAWDFLAFVGMYSYSIYLWHGLVPRHIRGFVRLFWPRVGQTGIFWSYVAVSLVVGIILSRLIEYPALHIRDRFFPQPQRVGVTSITLRGP